MGICHRNDMKTYDFEYLFGRTREMLRSAARDDVSITDISSADSSHLYDKRISAIISKYSLSYPISFSRYYFTGSLRNTLLDKVKKKLAGNLAVGITLLPSATMALNATLMFLKEKNVRKLAIIAPYYFISTKICNALGMKYEILPVERKDCSIFLPLEKILHKNFDAVLITSPVYGSSEYFTERIINDINLLQIKNKYVLFDEALAISGNELARKLNCSDYLFHIYSPHKSIGINAYKFSAIISSLNNENKFRECAEIYAGGLNQTSVSAIEHYISKDFLLCQNEYSQVIQIGKNALTSTLATLNKEIILFSGMGHYASVLPTVDYPGSDSYLRSIQACVSDYKIAFMPPWPSWNEGFKINMTYSSIEIKNAINAIVQNFGTIIDN